MLNANDFIKLREKDWQRLDILLKKRHGLSAEEVRELGTLYRAVTSDLALARRDYATQRVTLYLNQLLTRAHGFIYKEDVGDLKQFARIFTHTIPQTYRKTGVFTLVAFLLFAIPAVVAFHLASVNPNVAEPLGLAEQREILAEHETWTDIPEDERSFTSAFIMSNNIRVSILVFGGGVAFGVFAGYVLVINGLILGGVLGLATHYGMGDALLGFVIGHGVIELSVIFMAGGAGLQLGWALLNPGPYSRRDALTVAARRAGVLIVAAIPLLIIAGMIEGFVSPADTPFVVKAAVGLFSGALMYAYLLLVGWEKAQMGSPIKYQLPK
jgi:uncharacterized membrane protein SpoIIM required for sporulation